MRGATLSSVGLLAAIALSACGISDPYRSTGAAQRAVHVAPGAPPAGDDDGPPPPRRPVVSTGKSPQAALIRYAAIYLNWNAATVVSHQQQLAAISVGQARGQAQLAAAHAAASQGHLAAQQIANHGQPIAIAPGSGPAGGQWVIVTSETTSGLGAYQGLPATLHIIYARVARTTHGWVISEWQPQN